MASFAWRVTNLNLNMKLIKNITAIPKVQKYRYLFIIVSCLLFFAPFVFIPDIVGNDDLCGKMCMRRFFLYFPGMGLDDFKTHISVAWIGVILLASIFIATFFYGRLWCSYICPVGGFPELVSRSLNDRWKIEYRSLPQVPIRYGYFSVYLLLMPTLGISACSLCNFITVPRLFESFHGGMRGFVFIFSTIGLVNLALLILLGFFASKGRAYCQFLCPIGAMDGLINRMGAKLRFTRRIRVERDRCTGCNICARNCMTGAIKMVDKIAVVDQLSCMSCNECVDVCDWHAIDWLTLPPDKQPKRKKKGVDFHPLPEWEAVHFEKPKTNKLKNVNWQRVILTSIAGLSLVFFITTQAEAKQRHIDPDGCLVCHALQGLEYIDDNGVLRNSTIDQKHYYSSLHGSVPCKDCHRKIQDFPHKIDNGAVDCAKSCHLEEPSEGEAYTHKKPTEIFKQSIHGEGWSKGFTGGNRLEESEKQQNPSCRLCHQNSLYIDPEKIADFKTVFAHTETECGSCHTGKAWLNQFGGHIMRRFLSGRQNKEDENKMCDNCHADRERMQRVEIKDKQTGKTHKVSSRFILASDSYTMSLHGRLLANGDEDGVSCNDCHSPGKEKHSIQGHKDISASTHKNKLDKTCAASGCHQFSRHIINTGFTHTDMHDLDYIPLYEQVISAQSLNLNSPWKLILAFLIPIIIILIIGSTLLSIFGKQKRSVVFSLFGGNHFQKNMIGRKQKSKTKKSKIRRKKHDIKRNTGDAE
jgi:polyferredoxin